MLCLGRATLVALLFTGCRSPVVTDRLFQTDDVLGELRRLGEQRGYVDEVDQYDTGESNYGRRFGWTRRAEATRVGDRVVAILFPPVPGTPGTTMRKLLLLDEDGNLLDAMACMTNSRYGFVYVERSREQIRVGFRFKTDYERTWYLVTVDGETQSFNHGPETKALGFCTLAIRSGKFHFLHPELKRKP